MEHIVGIGLAGGRGERFRPLTLKARGYLRSKAAVLLLGRRVIDWLFEILNAQGVDDFVMITKGKENRYQIKSIVGYGEAEHVRVRYSPVSYDRVNAGSADSLLSNLEYFDLCDTALVFPTDSVLDIDLPAMLAAHRRSGAVVTITAARQSAESVAGRYGLILSDGDGRVRGFLEKPSLERIYAQYGTPGQDAALPPLITNAGFYLIETAALREISRRPDFASVRQHGLDIGGDLLPWLVAHDYPVHAFEIGRMGDLGNITSYLETMLDALHGRFHSMRPLLSHLCPCGDGCIIAPETMALTDPVSGLTLTEKIARGLVEIRPPVRVGKYVRVFPGVTLGECNIDDDCELFENATILRSSIGPGSLIGPYSRIEDTLMGFMTEVLSTPEAPVTITDFVAIGDEVVISAGVSLSGSVIIHPRLKIPRGAHIPNRTELESADAVLACL